MNIVKILGLLVLVSNVNLSYSQSNSDEQKVENLKSVIPPSPTASALGKYADWPVSLYTGVPSINIPLYNMQGRTLSVPISLSYHASGIKVSEVASWVGLGWSLNAGGVITRSVKGLPDELSDIGYLNLRQQYINKGDLSSGTGDLNLNTQNKINVADGKADTEPDYFSFNALGKAFKLFFKGDGTIVTIPYSQNKISVNFAQDNWIVILEDGTKLTFGESVANANAYIDKANASRYSAPEVSEPFTTAWYLREIQSINGEKFHFTYSNYNLRQDNSFFQSDYFLNDSPYGPASCSFNACVDNSTLNPKGGGSLQLGTGVHLTTIESDNCRIEFVQSTLEREDFRYGKSLAQIKVFSKYTNTYLKTFNFAHAYSAASNSSTLGSTSYHLKRLKLLQVDEAGSDNQNTKSWKFEYNPTMLPSIKSFAQDHWGYYNGATTNTTLLPQVFSNKYVVERGFNPNIHPIGDREPNADYMQAEMLRKVIYPTGGYSVFNFEPNGYPVTEEKFQSQTLYQAVNLTATSNPFTNSQVSSFTITKEQYVQLIFDATFTQAYLNDFGDNTPLARCRILNSSNNPVGGLSFNKISLTGGIGHVSSYCYLVPGTYTLQTNSIASSSADLSANDLISLGAILKYEASLGVMSGTKLVGGNRIKSIEDYDNTTNSNLKRFFKYEAEYVIHPFTYETFYLSDLHQELKWRSTSLCGEGLGGTGCYQTYLVRNSSPKADLGSIQGGTIGYGKVTTLYGENGNNGYTVSEFINVPDENETEAGIFPYPPTNSKEWHRGNLLTETQYHANNSVIHKTEHQYNLITQPPTIFAYKIGWERLKDRSKGWTVSELANHLAVRDIKISSGLLRPASTIQTDFVNNQPALVNTINYNYNNPNNLKSTSTVTINSKGETIIVKDRTPLEKSDINSVTPLTATASMAIDAMLQHNILSPVLQTEKWKVIGATETLLSRSLTNYRQWSTSVLAPENVQSQQLSNPLETRVEFKSYDTDGNLLEQQKTNDTKQVYLYGYNRTYPVAHVIGADYNTILNGSGINQAVLNNPSDDAAMRTELNKIRQTFPLALVTTYTYKPLIGMTSQTDPSGRTSYYEYDAFGRLSILRDQDNNIIKKYCYNYQGQPQNCEQ